MGDNSGVWMQLALVTRELAWYPQVWWGMPFHLLCLRFNCQSGELLSRTWEQAPS